MKKQLLTISSILFTTLIISAQAIITNASDIEIFSIKDISGVVGTPDVGNMTTGTTYFQLRGTNSITENLSGDVTFAVQTSSGTVDGNLSIEIRKAGGNSAEYTITVDGLTPQTFTLASDGTTGNGLELYNLEFSETITFTETPTNITVDLIDGDRGSETAIPVFRWYDATINKATTLSISDINIEENAFAAYPNPVNNSFEINTEKDIKNIQVFNFSGSLVKTLKSSATYDISDLKPGLYLATVTTATGSGTIKIIKK